MENGDLDSFASDESVGIVVGSINVFQRSPGPFDLVEMAFGFGDVTVVDVDIHLLDWLFVLEVVVIGYLYGHVGTLAQDAALLAVERGRGDAFDIERKNIARRRKLS